MAAPLDEILDEKPDGRGGFARLLQQGENEYVIQVLDAAGLWHTLKRSHDESDIKRGRPKHLVAPLYAHDTWLVSLDVNHTMRVLGGPPRQPFFATTAVACGEQHVLVAHVSRRLPPVVALYKTEAFAAERLVPAAAAVAILRTPPPDAVPRDAALRPRGTSVFEYAACDMPLVWLSGKHALDQPAVLACAVVRDDDEDRVSPRETLRQSCVGGALRVEYADALRDAVAAPYTLLYVTRYVRFNERVDWRAVLEPVRGAGAAFPTLPADNTLPVVPEYAPTQEEPYAGEAATAYDATPVQPLHLLHAIGAPHAVNGRVVVWAQYDPFTATDTGLMVAGHTRACRTRAPLWLPLPSTAAPRDMTLTADGVAFLLYDERDYMAIDTTALLDALYRSAGDMTMTRLVETHAYAATLGDFALRI